MKKLLLALLLLPLTSIAQNCVKVDSVYSTAKLRELGNRDIRFGVKQIAEEELSNKYCLSDEGKKITVEIFYFGIPKKSLRIVGVEKSDQITQVGVRMYFDGKVYQGVGESETEVRAIMIELSDGKIPFSKTTVSSAIKKAIKECVSGMP
jgi:hypothetical protein